ncbi:hypothetical protein [Mesorhizobium sp. ANAO-SY3R2]|uniref:hypothetical protein n=1 Tax=Mesorhizobium sp. ANAO-SY3R2 TaxID=3166644 RepID=UPI00367258F6
MADTLKGELANAENIQKAFEKQISELRREIAKINRSIAERGGEMLDEAKLVAGDAYQTASTRAARAARQLRTQAHSVSEVAKEHPRTTTALLGMVGVLGFLLGIAVARAANQSERRWH